MRIPGKKGGFVIRHAKIFGLSVHNQTGINGAGVDYPSFGTPS
jgi:hypothetical protein